MAVILSMQFFADCLGSLAESWDDLAHPMINYAIPTGT